LLEERALDIDRVDREILWGTGFVCLLDQALAVQEAERELLVLAGRAHRHRDHLPVDADLQRLLDGDLVLEAGRCDGRVRAADFDLGHRIALSHARRSRRPLPRRGARYLQASEDAVNLTSTDWAPCAVLEAMSPEWPSPDAELEGYALE